MICEHCGDDKKAIRDRKHMVCVECGMPKFIYHTPTNWKPRPKPAPLHRQAFIGCGEFADFVMEDAIHALFGDRVRSRTSTASGAVYA